MKKMYHPKHGWHMAENQTVEASLRALGWVDDRPEYSPKFVPAGPQEAPPPPSPPPPTAGPAPTVPEPPRRSADAPESIESVRATLDARGVAYDKRLGLAKLRGLMK